MKNHLKKLFALLLVCLFSTFSLMAQFNIKLPNITIKKPETNNKKEETKKTDSPTPVTNGKQNPKGKESASDLLYENQRPTSVPVLMKNTIHVQLQMHEEYWKAKGQSNYTSWVPLVGFEQFYDNEKYINYKVEYFNPDGSPWYSEVLEQSNTQSAKRTVAFKSPSPFGNDVLKTKSTVGTGVYSFKITNQDTKEFLFQGKFKVGKYSRANSASEKNLNGFYVDYDWLLPFGTIGLHYSGMEIGGFPIYANFWLKGYFEAKELEGRVFYKGQQIAATANGRGISNVENRESEFAIAYNQPHVWKRWEFQWENVEVDNNGSFNRQYHSPAHFIDKNPGDYTIKIYRNGTQIRELSFTVGADGKIVPPSYTKDIPLPHHTYVFPVKVTGTEKWDSLGWKNNAFYGNPLPGFVN